MGAFNTSVGFLLGDSKHCEFTKNPIKFSVTPFGSRPSQIKLGYKVSKPENSRCVKYVF